MQAYINATGQYLPGAAVSNAQMGDYIGHISPQADRLGALTLRQNGIRSRHYAVGKDGSSEHTASGMAALALKDCLNNAAIDPQDIGFLATSTTQNDMLVPGMASQTHAALGLPPMEIASLQSVCASSMMAVKYASLQVASGEHRAALACGSEFSSRYFRPGKYLGTDVMRDDGTLPGDAEFLRWTLSDGAAGLMIEDTPRENGVSLRIDWISLRSFADRFAPCMTGGVVQGEGDALTPWSHIGTIDDAASAGAFQLRQDIDALYRMLPVWLGEFMRLVDDGKIVTNEVDWFCCHYSARSLREEMTKLATKAGCMIPEERWFTNLSSKGNTGSASMFIMLEALYASNDLVKGQNILCFVPESGRFTSAFVLLTVC